MPAVPASNVTRVNDNVLNSFNLIYNDKDNTCKLYRESNQRVHTYFNASYTNTSTENDVKLYDGERQTGQVFICMPLSTSPWQLTGDLTWNVTSTSTSWCSVCFGDQQVRIGVTLFFQASTGVLDVSLNVMDELHNTYQFFKNSLTTLPFTTGESTPITMTSDADRCLSFSIGDTTLFHIDLFNTLNINHRFEFPGANNDLEPVYYLSSDAGFFESCFCVAGSCGDKINEEIEPLLKIHNLFIRGYAYQEDDMIFDGYVYSRHITTPRLVAESSSINTITSTSATFNDITAINVTATNITSVNIEQLTNNVINLSETVSEITNNVNEVTNNVTEVTNVVTNINTVINEFITNNVAVNNNITNILNKQIYDKCIIQRRTSRYARFGPRAAV